MGREKNGNLYLETEKGFLFREKKMAEELDMLERQVFGKEGQERLFPCLEYLRVFEYGRDEAENLKKGWKVSIQRRKKTG